MALAWSWRRFEDLGVDGVYDMLALRAKVFVLEQGPYLDPDGADRHAWHPVSYTHLTLPTNREV